MATRKKTAKKAAAKKTPAAPKSTAKSTSTAQKPLATGDVEQFPPHTFRADMGEGLPDQTDTLNPDRAK